MSVIDGPEDDDPAPAGPEAGAQPAAVEPTPPGRLQRVSARATNAQKQAVAKAEELEGRVPHLSLGRELYQRYRRQNATVLAGHLAFRSFLFILPVMVLMVAIAGFLRARGFDVSGELGGKLGLSTSLSHTVSDGADQASRGWAPLGFSALLAVAVTGSGLLSAFNYCFAQAWGLDAVRIPHRLSLTPKFVGSLITMVLLVAFVGTLRHLGLVASFGGIGAAMVVVGLAFFAVASILPHRSTAPQWLLPGSIAAPLAITGLQVFANYYLPDKVARSSSLYGSLGVAVTVLFYLYLLGNIIVGSALVNAVWWDHFHGPATSARELAKLPEPPAPPRRGRTPRPRLRASDPAGGPAAAAG